MGLKKRKSSLVILLHFLAIFVQVRREGRRKKKKRKEVKKMRSLVQVFEDQGMEISSFIYRNYKYGTLVWKVWTIV